MFPQNIMFYTVIGILLVQKINESIELLPELKVLSIRYLDENNEPIKYLLSNAIDKVQSFFFNNLCLQEFRFDKVDIGNYMESIINILPRIQTEAYFYYMKINAKQLASIIKNSAHIKRLGFIKCKLNMNSTIDLNIDNPYQIKSINLKGCGYEYRGGMMTEHDFEKLIKAISMSGLKESLVKIRTSDCNMKQYKVEQILDDYDMDKVDVLQQEI